MEGLARAGLVAKGLTCIVATLALKVALGRGSGRRGSPGRCKRSPSTFGQISLAALAIGLAGYAIWRFTRAAGTHLETGEREGALKRIGSATRVLYAWLAFICAGSSSTRTSRPGRKGRRRSPRGSSTGPPAGGSSPG